MFIIRIPEPGRGWITMEEIKFFMPMIPPTATHQEQRTGVRSGKPYRYEAPELKAARAKLTANLGRHVPPARWLCPIRLKVIWCFPIMGKHHDGEYKTSKPDTDNLNKLLKDCMTQTGFWQNDALVVVEQIEKYWADQPGIYVEMEELW